jgi:hypothetical protein
MIPSRQRSLHHTSTGSPGPEVRVDLWRGPESQNSHGARPDIPPAPVRDDRRDEQDDPVEHH